MAYLDKNEYKSILDNVTNVRLAKKKRFFMENVFQNDESFSGTDKIYYMWGNVKLKKGEHFYKQGDPITAVYVIKKGNVRLYKKVFQKEHNGGVTTIVNNHELMKKAKILVDIEISHLGSGEFVGEIEIPFQRHATHRNHAAIALSDVAAFKITRDLWSKS
jgi:hypothetical protein